MKTITLIFATLLSISAFSQRDTLVKESDGDFYEFYNNTMIIEMGKDSVKSDTIFKAYMSIHFNKLAWGDNERFDRIEYVVISDSLIGLFAPTFEAMVQSTGLILPEDSFGVYNTHRFEIKYDEDIIESMKLTYNKQEKSRNQSLTGRSTKPHIMLSQEQINIFSQLLLSPQIVDLYVDLYNRTIN